MGAFEGQLLVDQSEPAAARGIRLDVPEIAGMAFVSSESSVRHVARIEMAAGGIRVGRAAVTILMDMKPVEARAQPLNGSDDADSIFFPAKGDNSLRLISLGRVKHRNGMGYAGPAITTT